MLDGWDGVWNSEMRSWMGETRGWMGGQWRSFVATIESFKNLFTLLKFL